MDDIIASIIGEQDDQSIEIRSAAPPGSGNQFEPGSAAPFSGPDAEPGEDVLPHLIQQDELDALLSELQSRERARGVRDAEVPTKEALIPGRRRRLRQAPRNSLRKRHPKERVLRSPMVRRTRSSIKSRMTQPEGMLKNTIVLTRRI